MSLVPAYDDPDGRRKDAGRGVGENRGPGLPHWADERRGGSTASDFGPNAIADVSAHALGRALEKFWSPVPWMLESANALELVMGKFVEATVVGVLLVFNAGLTGDRLAANDEP